MNEEGITSALEAVKSVHELVVDSVKYSCRLGHMLEEFLKRNPRYSNVIPPRNPLPAAHRPSFPANASSTFEQNMMHPRMQDPRRIINPQHPHHQHLPGSVPGGGFYPSQESYTTYSASYSTGPSYPGGNPPNNWIPPAPQLSTYKSYQSYPSYQAPLQIPAERFPGSLNIPAEVPSFPSFQTYGGVSPSQSDVSMSIRTPSSQQPSILPTYRPSSSSLESERLGIRSHSDLDLTSPSAGQFNKESPEH